MFIGILLRFKLCLENRKVVYFFAFSGLRTFFLQSCNLNKNQELQFFLFAFVFIDELNFLTLIYLISLNFGVRFVFDFNFVIEKLQPVQLFKFLCFPMLVVKESRKFLTRIIELVVFSCFLFVFS
jgi:hypothetical protein